MQPDYPYTPSDSSEESSVNAASDVSSRPGGVMAPPSTPTDHVSQANTPTEHKVDEIDYFMFNYF